MIQTSNAWKQIAYNRIYRSVFSIYINGEYNPAGTYCSKPHHYSGLLHRCVLRGAVLQLVPRVFLFAN